MENAESVAKQEESIRSFWKAKDLLKLLKEKRKGQEKYFLLDGPPYANYEPHVGHIRNTVFKDLYVRWEFMKGKDVLFQPGFDTHGLPIENMVEKKLNLKSKKDIQKLGIQKFMKTCHDSAALNKDLWMHVYDLLGSWYSWKEPYLTYNQSYIESAWWAFKKLWDKQLVYEGKRPVFWCPSCETALAGYEATDSYKNVTDPSIYVKFPLKEEKDTFLLVYTTTPWTLPANVAVVIAPNEEYVKAKTKDHGTLILAKERLELLEKLEVEYEVIETFKGKSLENKEYESILDVPIQRELQKNKNALKVLLSIPILKERVGSKVAAKKGLKSGDIFEEFVTVKEGTGLVHCAPGHGKSDNEMGKKCNLPELSPVDDQCKLTKDAAPFDGKFVKDADHDIADKLNETKRLLHYGKIEHSYPLCWRCKSPLIFRLSNQWFLKIDPIKDQMLEQNDKVEWQPDFAKERFSSWVANADDWNFSRQRYWGIPIPIWKGKSGDAYAVESVEELKKLATKDIPEDFDIHAASEITIKHPKTGEELIRVNDIFDVWFDSGSAPFASLGYPFKNKELFENHFPVNRINESQDQIRGWFYSLMFCSTGVFEKAPYKTISMPGWVLDEKGDKMSKSVGNMVLAKDALEELGADAIRFYYCWDIDPAQTQKFNLSTIRNDVRKFFSIWKNLVKLTKGYEVKFSEKFVEGKESEDEWIISRLHQTIKDVREHVESFSLHLAGRSLSQFVMDDLSRTYVQFVRDRMENETLPAEIIGHALWQIGKLSAAITPYQSEWAYQELKSLVKEECEESVHLCLIPKPDTDLINTRLEDDLVLAGDVIAGILSARDRAKIGVRWPIEKVVVDSDDDETKDAIKKVENLILKQTNVRSLLVESFPVEFDGKVNFQALGKAYGQETGNAAGVFAQNKEAIIKGVTSAEKKVTVDNFEFTPDFVNLEKIVPDSHSLGEFKKGSIYLQIAVPRELEVEGFAREITRRFQMLRKKSGCEKNDTISACVQSEIAGELESYITEVEKKIGASALDCRTDSPSQSFDVQDSVKIKGVECTFFLSKS